MLRKLCLQIPRFCRKNKIISTLMFRPIGNLWRRMYQLSRMAAPIAIRPVLLSTPHLLKPLFMTTGCYLQMLYCTPFRAQQPSKEDPKFLVRDPPKPPTSLLSRIGEVLMTAVRFFHLVLIFTPIIVTFPLSMFENTRDFWIDMFVESVARAGVVWIKAFQYLSHRRDMIGEDVAKKFSRLREDAPQHSYRVTEQSFKREFGKEIGEIFESFDPVPIASGSVSQVYQAVYNGEKVAVKVRHPGVETYIERDINLLFFISRTLSVFSRKCEIPVGQESLKKTLTDQIDFNIEARNLKLFGEMFKNSDTVRFPKPIQQRTTPGVLVQTFVEGKPITAYEGHKHKLNNVIARIGALTFFEMLMKNNFIHADCHGGNIMVKIKQRSNTLKQQIKDFFHGVYKGIEKKLMTWSFSSKLFKDLYLESRKEDDEAFMLERQLNQKVEVTLIDVGMVIELNETDRKNFVNFIKSFIMQEPDQCAQMIYSLSLYKGHKIIDQSVDSYKVYYQKLKDLFNVIKNKDLKSIDGTQLFKNMLDLIRQSKMKLDGQFATLLTNMLVLEAIAKDLNPDINILKCAIPYFRSA